MDSQATLWTQEDFSETLRQFTADQEPKFQDMITDKRTLDELAVLADLAENSRQSMVENPPPLLALGDGSLILWQVAGRQQQAYEQLVIADYLKLLQRFQEQQIPIAGYISRTGSREVIQLIELIEQELNPLLGDETLRIRSLTDSALFFRLLKPAQRSILFHSRSQILEKYGSHAISYFYLHVGAELAKVEVPRWIAQNQILVNQIAAYCYQQAQLGQGYPVVLSEAHEMAVVRGHDRELFYQLIEQQLLKHHISSQLSAKQLRKRVAII
jgi:hypothetical protein